MAARPHFRVGATFGILSGDRSVPPASIHSVGFTIFATPLRPSLFVPASPPLTLSRFMGASLTMIDRHYGHLARDVREHPIRLLDDLSAEQRPPWTLVDAAWTPNGRNGARAGNGNGA